MTSQKELKLSLYRLMLQIRLAEEMIAARYKEQAMRCPVHLCVGQEAVPAGVCHALRRDDSVYSNHRAHGHYLAKGGNLSRFVAELYGRATGCAGGYGGSMHLIDKAAGFMGCAPVVGGTAPLAVGTAWANVLKKTDAVSVAFFGDGCFEEGVIHECLNFAALKKLPVLFVCENNGYSVYTPLSKRQPDRPIHGVARAHGWRVWTGDGSDALQVYGIARDAVRSARSGEGPQFLEFTSFRWREHCGPNYDPTHKGEESPELLKSHCPLEKLKTALLREATAVRNELDAIEKEESARVEKAFEFALSSPEPDPAEDLTQRVYADS